MSSTLHEEHTTVQYVDGESNVNIVAHDRGDWHDRYVGADRIDRNFITIELEPAFSDEEDADSEHITLHRQEDSRAFIEALVRAHAAAYGEVPAFAASPIVGEVTVHVNVEGLEEALLALETAQLNLELLRLEQAIAELRF